MFTWNAPPTGPTASLAIVSAGLVRSASITKDSADLLPLSPLSVATFLFTSTLTSPVASGMTAIV